MELGVRVEFLKGGAAPFVFVSKGYYLLSVWRGNMDGNVR